MCPNLGAGYGSEFHLMRFLGRHRNQLNEEIMHLVQCKNIFWLDSNFGGTYDPSHQRGIYLPDKEWVGLEFLNALEYEDIKKDWKTFWPAQGQPHHWDAVGVVIIKNNPHFLLVEAKANLPELEDNCSATDPKSRSMIENAVTEAIQYFRLTLPSNWMDNYYQFANRLATLYFLRFRGHMPTILLYIYFTGDKNLKKSSQLIPLNEAEWQPAILRRDQAFGLIDREQKQKMKFFELFLPVE